MQEDKKLKELLMKNAIEETSADFTNMVMQRIESATVAQTYSATFVKFKLLKMLVIAFVFVCFVLLAVSIYMRDAQLPFHFSVTLPSAYFSQIISFLIAFWVVIFFNQLWNKKKPQIL